MEMTTTCFRFTVRQKGLALPEKRKYDKKLVDSAIDFMNELAGKIDSGNYLAHPLDLDISVLNLLLKVIIVVVFLKQDSQLHVMGGSKAADPTLPETMQNF